MTTWLQNAYTTLSEMSVHDTFENMVAQWSVTGFVTEHELGEKPCELCKYPETIYEFEIINELNGKSLMVGSVCIKRFNIASDEKLRQLLTKYKNDKFNKSRDGEVYRSIMKFKKNMSKKQAAWAKDICLRWHRAVPKIIETKLEVKK